MYTADELTAVLKWLSAKVADLRRQAEPLKDDNDSLWNSGLPDSILDIDEWRVEILTQLAARSAAATPGGEGGE